MLIFIYVYILLSLSPVMLIHGYRYVILLPIGLLHCPLQIYWLHFGIVHSLPNPIGVSSVQANGVG